MIDLCFSLLLLLFSTTFMFLLICLFIPQVSSHILYPRTVSARVNIEPVSPSSLMSGLSAMDTKASGRLGVLTITYYLWTTFIAVIVGIVLVLIIHPGTGSEKDNHHASSGPVMTSADALLDLIR